MRFTMTTGAIAVLSLVQLGCADAHSPARATSVTGPAMARVEARPAITRTVNMLDQCDSASFNAVIGPGTCVGNGTVTFQAFIAELTATRKVATWINSPDEILVNVGETLEAPNLGGEAHTFTEVSKFGGGIIPLLNDLTKTGKPAPECLGLAPEDFIPPGGAFSEVADTPEIARYQCCLHPWMKATVRVR